MNPESNLPNDLAGRNAKKFYNQQKNQHKRFPYDITMLNVIGMIQGS